MMSGELTERALLFLLITAVAVAFFFNTYSPYHLDSVAWATAAKLKEFRCTFSGRCGTSLWIFFLSRFSPFEEEVTYSSVLILAFILTLLFLLLETKNAASAVFLAFLPASLVTVTIGKEDFVSLLFGILSVFLLDRIPFLSGISAGLAAISKETGFFFIGYCALLAVLRKKPLFFVGLSPFFLIDWFYYVFEPKSLYMGRFLGFFSQLQSRGLYVLLQGFGPLLLPLLLLEKVIDKQNFSPVVWAALVLLYLSNVTVVHYRHAIWIGAFLSLALRRSDRIFQYLLCISSLVSLIFLLPTLSFRALCNPQKLFFSSLSDLNCTFLAMDDCGLAKYYSKLPCMTHPVDPNLEEAQRFFDSLPPGRYCILPDFFAYDKYQSVRRVLASEDLNLIGFFWYENYHSVPIYGFDLLPGCRIVRTAPIGKFCGFEGYKVEMECANKQITVYAVKALFFWSKVFLRPVYLLEK